MACHHHHHAPPAATHRAFAIAIGVNLLFVMAEVFFALRANSTSLLADAGHNLTDVLGLVLAWIANWLQHLPASERYSYGYKRISIIAALINGLVLISAAAGIAIAAVYQFMHPRPITELTIIIVAGIGIVINGGTALLFMRDQAHDLNIKGAFLHLLYDALISLGIVITACIISVTQWQWLDPLLSLVIVGFIVMGTWQMLADAINLLLDGVPRQVSINAVSEFLGQIPGVENVHDLHIWAYSTRDIALTAHLIMPSQRLSDAQLAKLRADILHQFNINHVTIQVESGTDPQDCAQHDCC